VWFKPSWLRWTGAATATAIAATTLLMVGRLPAKRTETEVVIAQSKGAALLSLRLVAETAGRETGTFGAGERFKALYSCSHASGIDLQLVVFGADGEPQLFPVERNLACGNDMALQGAFTITSTGVHHACIRRVQEYDEYTLAPNSPTQFGTNLHACTMLNPIPR
jgi:hypothetical protein